MDLRHRARMPARERHQIGVRLAQRRNAAAQFDQRVIAKVDHIAHPAKLTEKWLRDDGEKSPAASADHLAGLLPVRQKGGEALFGQRVVEQRLDDGGRRSEEHTSELQSLMRISYAVFCLKKKKTNNQLHKH